MATVPTITNTDRIIDASPVVSTSVFNITWPVVADTEALAKDDLVILIDGVQLASSEFEFTGNSITGVSGIWNGGTVTLDSAVNGVRVIIYSKRDPRRTGSFLEGRPLPMTTLDALMNDNAIMLRDVHLGLKRALKFPVVDMADGVSPEITDEAADRSGRFLGFAADGSPTLLSGTGADSALRTDIASTASLTLGDKLIGLKRNLTGSIATTLHDFIETLWINVKDFGLVGGGADDTAAFTAAQAAATTGSIVRIPAGTWLANVTCSKALVWQGDGQSATIVRSHAAGGIVFLQIVNTSSFGLQVVFNDMTIAGPSGTRTATGVQFGNTVYAANDELAGRSEFNRVYFLDLNYGVRKLYGNIGNTFNRCRWNNTNFHYHTYADDTPSMHGGNDVFQFCYGANAQLAAFYIDSSTNGSSQIIIQNSIFELNPGFVFFVKNFKGDDWQPGISIINSHFEQNSTAANVTIDAVVYTPPKFARFVNVRYVSITKCTIDGVELVASTLETDRCHYSSNFVITADADSVHLPNNVHTDAGSVDMAGMGPASSIIGMERTSGGFVQAAQIKLPNRVSYEIPGGTIIASESFGAITAFTGTAAINTTDETGGAFFPKHQRLSYTSAQTELISAGSITTDRYYVGLLIIKKVSGNNVVVRLLNGTTLATFGTVSSANFRALAFITRAAATDTVALRCEPPASGTTVLALNGFCLVEFTNLQLATDFLNSGVFAANAGNVPRGLAGGMWGPAAPVTGTFNVGDSVENSSGVVGQPKSWKCTTAPTTFTSTGTL